MQLTGEKFFSLFRRETVVAILVFLATALFFISLSVFATTIGTNIDSTGTTGSATSTPWGDLAVDQVAGKSNLRPVFVVGDNATATPAIFVSQKGVVSFGSSTPSALFLNVGDVVIGRHGASNDLFVSGGLGVGNATTTDNAFVVGANVLVVYGNNNIGFGGTSTPALTDGVSIGTNTAGTNVDVYVSGGLGVGRATTTDSGFVVGDNDLAVYNNGNALIGGTTTTQGFTVEKAHSTFSSGADATTTVGILAESTTKGGCIEMTAATDGALYKIFINAAGNGLTVEAGSCAAN